MQTAKLVLVSKRGVNGALPAAPLAFALRGEVDARGPLKRIKTSAQLYEFQEVEVKLTNPFQVLLELGQSFQSVMHACGMVKLLSPCTLLHMPYIKLEVPVRAGHDTWHI